MIRLTHFMIVPEGIACSALHFIGIVSCNCECYKT